MVAFKGWFGIVSTSIRWLGQTSETPLGHWKVPKICPMFDSVTMRRKTFCCSQHTETRLRFINLLWSKFSWKLSSVCKRIFVQHYCSFHIWWFAWSSRREKFGLTYRLIVPSYYTTSHGLLVIWLRGAAYPLTLPVCPSDQSFHLFSFVLDVFQLSDDVRYLVLLAAVFMLNLWQIPNNNNYYYSYIEIGSWLHFATSY